MDRRTFVGALGGGFIALPLLARAQRTATMPRIGILATGSLANPLNDAFHQGLREQGYAEDRNLLIESRSAEGHPERLPALAAELVALNVDVIVTNGAAAIRAAKSSTATIPIVMAFVNDPVAAGFVASLARPGGNITGLTTVESALVKKRLELLAQAVPRIARVAVLQYARDPAQSSIWWQDLQAAAKSLAIRLQAVDVEDPKDFVAAFAAMRAKRADALIVLTSSFFFLHRIAIAELAAQNRIPAAFENRQFVEAGGLLSYGPSYADMFRRAATYVDKILKGAKPADLPVAQPIKFELVINVKTAKALGLTIPQSIMVRADEVIQ